VSRVPKGVETDDQLPAGMIRVLLVQNESCVAESLTGYGTIQDAVEAMREGALDFLVKPVERERLEAATSTLEATPIEPRLPAASEDLNLKARIRGFERELFKEALCRADGKKSDAARMLGIDPSNWAYHAKRLKKA